MSLTEIFSILAIHWFADFVLQTDEQAKGKSKSWLPLLNHTLTYSLVWTIVGALYILVYNFNDEGIIKWFSFVLITFIAHTITDYYTSRLNSKLIPQREYAHNYGKSVDQYSFFRYKNENWRKFFISVGFDQYLHYVQLFTTYYLLK